MKNNFQLAFTSSASSPLAYSYGLPISGAQFKQDVTQTIDKIVRSGAGNTLITTPGRYAFSVALLASWLAGRTVVLPPGQHEHALKIIREQQTICIEFDPDWGEKIKSSHELKPTIDSNTWEVELPASLTAVILYTSGSTGIPQAVEKSLANLLHEVDCLYKFFDWSDAPIVGTVPVHHLYGLTFTILLPWVSGVSLIDEIPMFAPDVSRTISLSGAQTLVSVPVHYNALLQAAFNHAGLHCFSATAPLPEETASRWHQQNDKQIVEIYGSTETGVIGFRQQLEDECWQPFEPVTLAIKSDLPYVSSPFISQQFNGKFEIADRVNVIAANRFELHGRVDSIVKIGGKRISLLDIEQSLLRCSNIIDAATIVVPVDGLVRDSEIWAAIVSDNPDKVNVIDIRSQLRERLDPIFIPKRFIFVERLPRSSSGKLPRQALEDVFGFSGTHNV